MKKKCIFLLISICIILIILIVTLVVMNVKKYSFKIPEFDSNSKVCDCDIPKELNYSKLEVDKGYIINICGELYLNEDKNVPIYFKSDENNKVYVKFRIYDKNGNLLNESGLVKPGETLEYIKIDSITSDVDIDIKIMGYDMETYFSQGVVNLVSKIKITK